MKQTRFKMALIYEGHAPIEATVIIKEEREQATADAMMMARGWLMASSAQYVNLKDAQGNQLVTYKR